jgi:long-chain fatty acid transport protein
MQGASTAAPIDAAGALYWNPASISGLQSSEALVGLELLLPTEEIS